MRRGTFGLRRLARVVGAFAVLALMASISSCIRALRADASLRLSPEQRVMAEAAEVDLLSNLPSMFRSGASLVPRPIERCEDESLIVFDGYHWLGKSPNYYVHLRDGRPIGGGIHGRGVAAETEYWRSRCRATGRCDAMTTLAQK